MADKQRFECFADLLVTEFPQALRIFDVAGGMGRLNQALTARGRTCTTFDLRHKRLDVPYAERVFALSEPCEADLVVGLHPDGATRIIIEYAALHRIPFAIVPCCSDNSLSYKPWMRHLHEFAQSRNMITTEVELTISGRRRVILGRANPMRLEAAPSP